MNVKYADPNKFDSIPLSDTERLDALRIIRRLVILFGKGVIRERSCPTDVILKVFEIQFDCILADVDSECERCHRTMYTFLKSANESSTAIIEGDAANNGFELKLALSNRHQPPAQCVIPPPLAQQPGTARSQ